MKIAILCSHSPANAGLARLTAPNHWEYASANGYGCLTSAHPMDTHQGWMLRELSNLLALLPIYDTVMMVEPDVLFTNHGTKISDILWMNTLVALSREPEGRSPVNVGVSIWNNYATTREFIRRLIDDFPIWSERKVGPGWQEHISETPPLLNLVTVLPPRILCATDQGGEWHWEKGDLLCHFLGGTVESKTERIKAFRP